MNYRKLFTNIGLFFVAMSVVLFIGTIFWFRYSYAYSSPSIWVGLGTFFLALIGAALINLITYGLRN